MADLYEGEPIVLALKAPSLPDQAILHGLMGTQQWSFPLPIKQATNRSGLSRVLGQAENFRLNGRNLYRNS